MGEAVGVGASLEDVAAEGEPVTMAAQGRGSVKVLVQPGNESLLAIAAEFVSSRSVRTLEEELGAAAVEFHVAKLSSIKSWSTRP
ncbi:hypothetical protein GCM10022204_43870 [Microlunatus aurantiacus]|uniref:Uncharacterized protein n=1 Tax=Microlunatus aurantiacus TaxID=446786 RepID=A0ABP7EGU4_9ACTN